VCVRKPFNAPDENPAIASLLEDAATLATAANEKLGAALAIAERDAAFNADRQWFKSRPDRNYRARLATAQEVEDLHSSGAWPPGWVADESCFVYAVVKHEPGGRLEALYFVLPPPRRELREDELERIWDNANKGIAEIARRAGQ
jgi:hypothetical protein